jgi:hypothetical protein
MLLDKERKKNFSPRRREGREENQKCSLTAEAPRTQRRPNSKLKSEMDLIEFLCELCASAVNLVFSS